MYAISVPGSPQTEKKERKGTQGNESTARYGTVTVYPAAGGINSRCSRATAWKTVPGLLTAEW